MFHNLKSEIQGKCGKIIERNLADIISFRKMQFTKTDLEEKIKDLYPLLQIYTK
jgi:hypothetical protein